ncbi:MAG: phage tail protein [Bryobacteraceae bacterium]
MSDQYIGEIRMVGFNFAPVGWMLCNGQILAISSYNALFALLGTTFGGDGVRTFALPDLQGRVPINVGNGAGLPVYTWGQKGGWASVTLLANNLPAHTHQITPPVSNVVGTTNSPVGGFPAVDSTVVSPETLHATAATKSYATAAVSGQTAGTYQSGSAGGNVPLNIQPPYLAVYFIIAVTGVFPTRE